METIIQLEQKMVRAEQTLKAKGCQVYLAKDAAEAASILQALLHPKDKVIRSVAAEMQEIKLDMILDKLQTYWQRSNLEEAAAAYHQRKVQRHPLMADIIDLNQEQILAALEDYIGAACPFAQCLERANTQVKKLASEAKWGITGANAVLIDTGTLVLAENQGDGRLVSNLPAQHIAIVGIEKLYAQGEEALEDIRSAYQAGLHQNTPVYYSLITGPSRTGDIEGDIVCGMHGPLAVHVILLDNGRSALMKKGHGKLLCCRDCGACTDSLEPLAQANHWPAMLLTCKNAALLYVQGQLPDVLEAEEILPFSCPAGITPEDLLRALQD